MSKSNPCSKTRELNNPYEVWKCKMQLGFDVLEIEYRVLKKYRIQRTRLKPLMLCGILLLNQRLHLVIGSMEICMLKI